MKAAISASMMCADIARIPQILDELREGKVEYLHIDVMDGVFVQNYTLGTDYCKALKRLSPIPLDIHLMITDPELKLDWFEFGEGDIVSVHAESTNHLQKALAAIRKRGAKAYAALKPATPLNVLEEVITDIDGVLIMTVNPGFAGQKMVPGALNKIERTRRLLDTLGGRDIPIEVDGNVSFENARKMRKAGADIFVAGSSGIFTSTLTLPQGIAKMRNSTEENL